MHATFADIDVRPGRLAISSQSGTIGAAIVEHARPGRARHLDVRRRRQQGRRQRQRPAAVLGGRRGHRRRAAVPGVVRQSAPVRPHRPPGVSAQADRRGSGQPGRATFPAATPRSGTEPPELESWAEPDNWPPDATVDALLAQTGVVRVDNLTQMFHTANVLLHQPLPLGRRVAILSNSSGTVRLATDACRGGRPGAGGRCPRQRGAQMTAVAGARTGDQDVDHHVDLPREVDPGRAGGRAAARCSGTPGSTRVMVLYAQPISGGSREVAAAVLDVAETRARAADRRLLPRQPRPRPAASRRRRGPGVPVPGGGGARAGPGRTVRRLATGALGRAPRLRRCGRRGGAPDGRGELLDGHPNGRWLDPRQAADLLATHGIAPVPAQLVDERAKRRSTPPRPSATRWRSRRPACPGWPRPRQAASHSTSTVTRRSRKAYAADVRAPRRCDASRRWCRPWPSRGSNASSASIATRSSVTS